MWMRLVGNTDMSAGAFEGTYIVRHPYRVQNFLQTALKFLPDAPSMPSVKEFALPVIQNSYRAPKMTPVVWKKDWMSVFEQEVYDKTTKFLIKGVLRGYNATVRDYALRTTVSIMLIFRSLLMGNVLRLTFFWAQGFCNWAIREQVRSWTFLLFIFSRNANTKAFSFLSPAQATKSTNRDEIGIFFSTFFVSNFWSTVSITTRTLSPPLAQLAQRMSHKNTKNILLDSSKGTNEDFNVS